MRYRRSRFRYAVVMPAPPAWAVLDTRTVTEPRFAQHYWRPAADLCESASAIEVIVELAGVDQDQIEVVLYEDAVVVEGQRHLAATEPSGVYHVAEVRQGPFRLELPLPMAFDLDRVEARYDQGLLRITFPKLSRAQIGRS
jgi:HSP20 family protein